MPALHASVAVCCGRLDKVDICRNSVSEYQKLDHEELSKRSSPSCADPQDLYKFFYHKA